MTELLELARKIAGQADGPDEQVEAFVAKGRSTSVKVHGGKVESLTQAASAGVGVRVVRDGRQGFAWAASLDDTVVAEMEPYRGADGSITTLQNSIFSTVPGSPAYARHSPFFAPLCAPSGIVAPISKQTANNLRDMERS